MVEAIIDIAIFNNIKDIEKFQARVNESNYKIIKKRLEIEKKKMLEELRKLQVEGVIKSIRRPRNKIIKKELEELMLQKKKISQSIKKIQILFY